MLNFKNKSNFFFESINSYDNDYLDVGDGHKIYYEQYGNPHGKPVLFLPVSYTHLTLPTKRIV